MRIRVLTAWEGNGKPHPPTTVVEWPDADAAVRIRDRSAEVAPDAELTSPPGEGALVGVFTAARSAVPPAPPPPPDVPNALLAGIARGITLELDPIPESQEHATAEATAAARAAWRALAIEFIAETLAALDRPELPRTAAGVVDVASLKRQAREDLDRIAGHFGIAVASLPNKDAVVDAIAAAADSAEDGNG